MRLRLLFVVCLLLAAPAAGAAAPNDAPFADAGLDRTVVVGEAVLLDGGGSLDPDGRLVGHEWRVETPAGDSVAPPNATAERTRFEPGSVGRYTVTLTVRDDDGVARTDSLFVRVRAATDAGRDRATAPNAAPTGYLAGPATVPRGATAPFRANVTDPDGRIVAYEWSTGADGRRTDVSFDAAAGTAVPLSVTATDDDGATLRLNRTITVRPPAGADANRPPAAFVVGPDRVAVGESATFTLRGHDADGDVVRSAWLSPVETDGSALTRSFSEPGTHVVRGRVVDDDGATGTAATTVEVYAEGPPAATLSGPETAPAGSVRAYGVETFDPDGGPVRVSWDPARTGPGGSRFENAVRMPDDPGSTVTVSATVTDDEGDRVTVERTVTLTNATGPGNGDSSAPLSVSGIVLWRVVDPSYQTSTADTIESGAYVASARVEGGDGPVTARWTFGDGTVKTDTLGAVAGGGGTSVRHLFTSDDGGWRDRALRVTATDGDGDTATVSRRVTVHTVATHPNVTFDASAGPSTDGTAETDGPKTVSTVVGQPVAFAANPLQPFRVEYGDGRVEEFARSRVPTRFSHTYGAPGTYTVQLTTVHGPDGYGAAWAVVHVASTSSGAGRITPHDA